MEQMKLLITSYLRQYRLPVTMMLLKNVAKDTDKTPVAPFTNMV